MTVRGENLIGAQARRGTEATFRAVAAATGEPLEPDFPGASLGDLDRACALADAAFDTYREAAPEARAGFLEAIAANLLDIGDDLLTRCMAETGLPRPRIEGECARTVGQLRLFAGVVREGSAVGVRIDPALPDRKPLPRPDLRLRRIAVGPVAVFGASNFPLAFSVAGGDTASALAAGCPVVVKAHPAHPGTSELVGRAIQRAVSSCGLPEGTFSLLFDAGQSIGRALVADPRICAVGFTGSRRGGTALMDIAARRPRPIPVYAEMSSINPVLLFPGALAARGAAIGRAFAASLTLGAGQFCTNPGLILAQPGAGLDAFVAAATAALRESPASTMLTPGIHRAYREGVARLAGHASVTRLVEGPEGTATQGRAALFATEADSFLAEPELQEEMFGAAALVVRCPDFAAIRAVLEHLEGQLTASLHIAPEDHAALRTLLPLLERRVGRILVDGFGTGVEVAHAMVHGGPYPATSDGRTTSVGSLAIERFLRPVSYQDVPETLLPAVLQADNPLGLPRRIDGILERG
ncbi:aldehyde dehydrogenase (NADP(+)) [Methylobacterium sp. NEAU K]|uniref:aldehyde dehydrogenase (NADP(+)) n=1 Tax=Methylobacterium sp. NEAU K TaxID=3064946 RepID=UPI0027322CFD|nr:aldehyde dehydrogenase (NADP(+)) [Methylobacterium sp. NEAU K]MDP4003376.1 aldehyde dehydrogenase (NADP(+)) [Methylobacterium sp. NEAU K]